MELNSWFNMVTGDGWYWYVKYLAGNDTLLTGAHQAGAYIPLAVAFAVCPSVNVPTAANPRVRIHAEIDSHHSSANPTLIWYNNRITGGTRNECRFTGWGGHTSPLLDPESTGALCVFAFYRTGNADPQICRTWLCRDIAEEDAVVERIGPVEPGIGAFYNAGIHLQLPTQGPLADSPCALARAEIPESWLMSFPEAAEVVQLAIDRLPTARQQDVDLRLVRRRECEYQIFRSIEDAVVLPRIAEGFATVDLFVDLANSVTNRRKSRSGASLELHTRAIFDESHLRCSYDEESEGGKRPDFLFPSAAAYRDPNWPAARLQMLAVKTTCKDRWRQVLDEARRLPEKYLLTLQQGVSPTQYQQMRTAGVRLVVPRRIQRSYSPDIVPELLSLSDFIRVTQAKCESGV